MQMINGRRGGTPLLPYPSSAREEGALMLGAV
jgi:hypothetical protein